MILHMGLGLIESVLPVPLQTEVRTLHGVSPSLQLLQGFSAGQVSSGQDLAVRDAAPGVSVGHTDSWSWVFPACGTQGGAAALLSPATVPSALLGSSCYCLPSMLGHRGLLGNTQGFPECAAPSCRAAVSQPPFQGSVPLWGCACLVTVLLSRV